MKGIFPEWIWTSTGIREETVVVIDGEKVVDIVDVSGFQGSLERLPGKLLLPGLVNAHSHAFQRAFRGHVQWHDGEKTDFWTWRNQMYGFANGLSPEGIHAVSRLAFLEMVESGITHVGEFHYLHHHTDGTPYENPNELAVQVIEAAKDVGLRISLLRVAYGRNGPQDPLQKTQRRFGDPNPESVLKAVEGLSRESHPLVSVGLAPHSVRAVPPHWWEVLSSFEGVMHSHVAEQPKEVEGCREETGCSPLAFLESKGILSPNFVGVHLTHPDPEDKLRLQAADAGVCVCPTTEMDLGDGFFPAEFCRGIRLCVGSDSQTTIDMLQEARLIEWHGRAQTGSRHMMGPAGDKHGLAERILEIATTEGSRSLGTQGGIKVGNAADFMALNLDRPGAEGVPPLEAAAFGSNPDWVSDVWVNGKHLVMDGRHPSRDQFVQSARGYLTSQN